MACHAARPKGGHKMGNEFEFDYFRVTVKVWRKMHNLAPAELAELAGVGYARLGVIENGGGTPTMAEFTHLCDLMEENACTFFKTPRKTNLNG